ncbi:hypothetical protein EVA_22389 [gut metagenome]|uniref:Uncharacterized protein n=1 Tax=gut metagenome TaxID=749906 RepID=J9FIM1_9ZZZZ
MSGSLPSEEVKTRAECTKKEDALLNEETPSQYMHE